MSIKSTIPFSHFVTVTSVGVSAAFVFNRLNALVITTPMYPMKTVNEILTLEEVAALFGVTSPEYAYAREFFGYVSKTATTPERLTFWSFYPTAQPAALVGGKVSTLASIKKSGAFTISIDGAEALTISLDITSATSFTEAAQMITAALSAATATAVCTYNAVTGGFIIEGEISGAGHTLSFAGVPSGGTLDMSMLLQLTEQTGAYLITGAAAQAFSECLNNVGFANGNWYSVATLTELAPDTDFENIAAWVKASQGRYMFIAHSDDVRLKTSGTVIYESLFGSDGFALNAVQNKLVNAFLQAAVAAVDYSAANGAMNFNFIEAAEFTGLAIGTASELEAVNANRANTIYNMGGYGQSLTLYGEGNIFGKDFSDISGYVGNSWLKAQFEIAGVNLMVAIPLISLRGKQGQSLILTALQDAVNRALNGGIIVQTGEGSLTSIERAAVITATNSAEAVNIIEQTGYYIRINPLTDEDIKLKRLRVLFLYTRNVPTNRLAIQNYVLGA